MAEVVLPTVRQSFLARFELCPLSALLGEQQADFTTHAQARGTVYHAFVAEVVAECIEREQASLAPEEGRAVMARLISESIEPIPEVEHDSLLALAWKFCRDQRFDLEHVVDLEEGYSAEVGGVLVTGRPDYVAIDGTEAEIRDYKTSFAIEAGVENGGTFQLRLYALLVAGAYPHLERFRLVLDYPRWSEWREATIERSELGAIAEHVESLITRLRRARDADLWPASPGSWCATCPEPLRCPIPAEDRGEGSITTPEQATAAAEYLVAAEAAVARAKKALRAWCTEGGAIPVGDLDYGWALKRGSEKLVDRDGLKQAMGAAGLDWRPYFRSVKGSTEFKARKRVAVGA